MKSNLTALGSLKLPCKTTHSLSGCGLSLNMKRSQQKMAFRLDIRASLLWMPWCSGLMLLCL